MLDSKGPISRPRILVHEVAVALGKGYFAPPEVGGSLAEAPDCGVQSDARDRALAGKETPQLLAAIATSPASFQGTDHCYSSFVRQRAASSARWVSSQSRTRERALWPSKARAFAPGFGTCLHSRTPGAVRRRRTAGVPASTRPASCGRWRRASLWGCCARGRPGTRGPAVRRRRAGLVGKAPGRARPGRDTLPGDRCRPVYTAGQGDRAREGQLQLRF